MFRRLFIVTISAVVLLSMVGCGQYTIIDLIHPETERFYTEKVEDVFNHAPYEPYINEGIYMFPVTRQNQKYGSDEEGYYSYSLGIVAYKKYDNLNTATINHIKVVGTNDVAFKEIEEDINVTLEFGKSASDDPKYDSLLVGESSLIEEINNYNLNLSDESVITFIMNVSIHVNGKTITKDIKYDLKRRKRTYSMRM
ncbi:hypothetical protein [Cytobacillus sp. IB215316]|uniref:hypothetical protein n=1 Tax=Cytobacillus sp. IB215316 TaxID=3097354 RepID=UPI002A1527CF|nr:hypothetical protein [Cytobacillus sp. IB215316]MDX8360783.1 hypothetical protein [Cytobacillus sp. IB215316]